MSKRSAAVAEKSYPTQGFAKVIDAAEFLSVSKHTIYRMVEANEIKHQLVRESIRIPWQALHEIHAAAMR